MSIHKEEREVVGMLYSQGQEFELLELNPSIPRELSLIMREHTFRFFVVGDDFAQYIIVGRENFVIVPYLMPKTRNVNFLILDEIENVHTDETYKIVYDHN